MVSLALAILLWYKVSPRRVGCSGVSTIDFLPLSQKLPIKPALHWLLQRALSNDSAHPSTHTKNIPYILTPSTHNPAQMTPGKALVLCLHQHELNLPSGGLRISRTWCICPSLMGVFGLIQALELAIFFQQIYRDVGYSLQDCDKPKCTTEKENSVPQNQLFHCPFLLGETWKIWFCAAFKLQTKPKLLLNILFHLQDHRDNYFAFFSQSLVLQVPFTTQTVTYAHIHIHL